MSKPLSVRLSRDRYINLLTDFGFKRLFGTEPNKNLLIDFLNVILPAQHHVKDLTYRNTENLGNTPIDRKAIFDLYCESETGEKFIVEMQKAKHNYFKDRSIYYSTFPIQEQAEKGDWNYKLTPVYAIGILDFIFDEDKNDDTLVHIVELKDQDGKVFYEKLKFIYLELPKFKKSIDQLNDHFDKWLFLLKHLPELEEPPLSLQENVFMQLFEASKIASFSQEERDAYENSLKYYRDLKGVVDTAREEGIQEGKIQGIQEGKAQGIQEGKLSLLLKQLARKLGIIIPDEIKVQLYQLDPNVLDTFSEALFDLENLEDLHNWLKSINNR
ncbi:MULTISPECIES: Rpn family recombination-promoting nuclease/putative transposase [Pseudanabaena]|jgi:predicted transposase/invertase (TIGR01784 family)|uniref:Rpn family recombination-promoting nuclease/putative transposase n=1 Tax=Pseudanabaena TaxID=1152 RepID=UPI0024785378|nr:MULTISPECIES: Rpn family recombination-promoting nuclease/putative transposase [Pseudanabaena]MEA5485212.1 Rpn family recombination-promoting nuclease/putative transposase [Pseudanabaena sp. CCNP1317]WGS72657.1 Rpn family recombination-promoting nuclease/putative transposase [Pseudanabaena galeata CCNP1313]